MFKPNLVIRDERPLTQILKDRVRTLLSSNGPSSIPDFQICEEYVSRRTQGIIVTLCIVAVTICSVAVYQTAFPEPYDSSIIRTADVELPTKNTPNYQVAHHPPTLTTRNVSHDVRPHSELTDEDNYCLAQNIYFEARNEPLRGQLAVGIVTLNRVNDPKYPNNVCDVVWQYRQFSWTHDGLSDKPREGYAWERSQRLASFLLSEGGKLDFLHDFTDNATHYHADYVSPYWRRGFEHTTQVGLHLFYRMAEADNI